MSEQLDPERKFRAKIVASEYLLRAVPIKAMLLDPGFAQDARQWFDHMFGVFSASEKAETSNPQIISAIREEYMRLLDRAEKQIAGATAVAKPKSLRRHIFERFERA